MPHPLSDRLFCFHGGLASFANAYRGQHSGEISPVWAGQIAELLRSAAASLDAYHEALDGLEIVECTECDGVGSVTQYDAAALLDCGDGTEDVECDDCNGTGKVLRKKEV